MIVGGHGRNQWGVRTPKKLERTPKLSRSFLMKFDYVTDCTKLGRPVYFFHRRVVIP